MSEFDLTENRDFSKDTPPITVSRFVENLMKKSLYLFSSWTKNCLWIPPKKYWRGGYSVFVLEIPHDRCERCGRLIPPWSNGLCKKCTQDLMEEEDTLNILRGSPEMESRPEVLWR